MTEAIAVSDEYEVVMNRLFRFVCHQSRILKITLNTTYEKSGSNNTYVEI